MRFGGGSVRKFFALGVVRCWIVSRKGAKTQTLTLTPLCQTLVRAASPFGRRLALRCANDAKRQERQEFVECA
ncbi:hypothetical protein LC593_07040 [Nostoc sp. CHAB 5844]|nr:hypothetical protein [Nostoc sp. CHAB 5844]